MTTPTHSFHQLLSLSLNSGSSTFHVVADSGSQSRTEDDDDETGRTGREREGRRPSSSSLTDSSAGEFYPTAITKWTEEHCTALFPTTMSAAAAAAVVVSNHQHCTDDDDDESDERRERERSRRPRRRRRWRPTRRSGSAASAPARPDRRRTDLHGDERRRTTATRRRRRPERTNRQTDRAKTREERGESVARALRAARERRLRRGRPFSRGDRGRNRVKRQKIFIKRVKHAGLPSAVWKTNTRKRTEKSPALMQDVVHLSLHRLWRGD